MTAATHNKTSTSSSLAAAPKLISWVKAALVWGAASTLEKTGTPGYFKDRYSERIAIIVIVNDMRLKNLLL